MELATVNPVFHVSMLRKYVGDPDVIVPLDSMIIKENLTYEEILIEILDDQVKGLRNKEIASGQGFVEESTSQECCIRSKSRHDKIIFFTSVLSFKPKVLSLPILNPSKFLSISISMSHYMNAYSQK